MTSNYEDALFRDARVKNTSKTGNLLKANEYEVVGSSKISLEDNDFDDVKILLKKDANDNLKEIKFMCSCGQTKSILLDYGESGANSE
ncbi:MAG: hypothetical protein M1495_23025 [Bacteroidetes bacterium]|nr:hypothetical protein [Bacteroidota bacterium]